MRTAALTPKLGAGTEPVAARGDARSYASAPRRQTKGAQRHRALVTHTPRVLLVVVCAALGGALAAPAARAGLVPDAGSPYPAGTATFAVAVGDFNGDGRPDLAAPAEDSDDVTVLLGQAGGDYAAAPGSPFAVGQRPADAAAADFDADGRSDLAVANFGRTGDGDTITVLLGQPDGSLIPESDTTIGVGTGPTSVAAAKIDGDARPDLVVTNQQSSSVTILLRRPGGGFTEEPGSPVSVGSAPFETAVGEFNGDGRPDLAVTNQFSGDVSILLRQPGGGFAAAAGSPLAGGSQPLGNTSADFDGDGAADLAFANFQSDSVSVYLGHGDGSFRLEAGAPIHTGDSAYGVADADFDGDGRPDLAVSDQFD